MKRPARLIVVICSVLALVAYGARVWAINDADKASATPVEHYAMGQWVDLSGTFIDSQSQAPEGYAVRIDKAELLTPDEYIRDYGAEGEDLVGEDGDKTVICLTYDIRHEGSGKVGIVLFIQRLIGSSKNYMLFYDSELWKKAHPEFQDIPSMFALRPDSSYTAHIAFSNIRDPDAFQSYLDSPRDHIKDRSFELLLSNLPTRKVVDVELP